MKPFFALTLDDESIGLLHRRPDGWSVVGSVRFDTPELAEALAALRARAEALEPEGLATKLVLPASQILYSTVYAPGPGRAVRRAQIEAALEGQTPYELDELRFDWSGEGEHVAVAVVARETLAEAEAFAVEHGFNPLCTVANPEDEGFDHAPWFGPTAHAAEMLGASAGPERDDALLVILPPEPEPVEEPEPEAPAEEAVEELTEELTRDPAEALAADAAEALPEEPEATEAEAEASSAEPEPSATEVIATEPAPEAAEETSPENDALDRLAETAATPRETEVFASAIDAASPVAPEALSAPPEESVPPEQSAPEPAWEAPPAAAFAPPAPAEPTPAPSFEAEAPRSEAPAPSESPAKDAAPKTSAAKPVAASLAASLATRQSEAAPGDEGEQTLSWPGEEEGDGDPLGATKAALAASLDPAPALADPQRGASPRETSGKRIEPLPAMPGAAPRLNLSMTPPTGTATLTEKPPKSIAKPGKGAKVKVTPPLKGKTSALPASTGQAALPQAATEAEAMTVFGQRNERRIGGKPRYLGLALTGALLVILLLIAVWAASFLEPDTQSSALETVDQQTAANLAPEGGSAATEMAEAEADADGELADAETGGGQTIAAAPEAPAETEVAAPAAAEPEAVTAPQPAASQQATVSAANAPAQGLAPAEGPLAVTGAVETLTRPLPDGAVTSPPAARLASTAPSTGDAAPATPSALPAFGALFKFDDAGNIIPTPEGVVTPDGVTLMAARPARLPPQRPAGLVPEAVALTAETAPAAQPATAQAQPGDQPAAGAEAQSATVSTSSGFEPDQTLAGQRPRQRPGNLAPAAPSAAPTEEGALPGWSEPASRAGLRPASRPASIAAAAERDLAAAAATAMASANSIAALDPSLLPLTRRPPARPASLVSRANTATATAAAAAAAAAAATQQTASLASPALQARLGNAPRTTAPEPPARSTAPAQDIEDDGEPEVVRAAPAIPTRASVAKQATVTRGLRLNGLNLIGVFGTSNARYALVRENSGRMNQVRVGDRLDGGQVVSIGQSELAYRKRGGQTVRLQMPRG